MPIISRLTLNIVFLIIKLCLNGYLPLPPELLVPPLDLELPPLLLVELLRVVVLEERDVLLLGEDVRVLFGE